MTFSRTSRIASFALSLTLLAAASLASAQAPAAPVAAARASRPAMQPDARTYRLTFTLTELDGNRRVGSQHFSMVATTGGKTILKQGSKIPIATGTVKEGNGEQTQFTYIDIGINIDASLDDAGPDNRVSLRGKIEQSSVGEEKTISGVTEPVIRQTLLDATSLHLTLGSVDIPGSTRHVDVEVLAEPSH
jgi:type II secretory pathway component GspD/PulD (secretin)